jgi:hypothetical protein
MVVVIGNSGRCARWQAQAGWLEWVRLNSKTRSIVTCFNSALALFVLSIKLYALFSIATHSHHARAFI